MSDFVKRRATLAGKNKKIYDTAKDVKKTGRINVDDLRRAARRLGYKLTKKKKLEE